MLRLRTLYHQVTITDEALDIIAMHSNGDIRYALKILDICAVTCENTITKDTIISLQKYQIVLQILMEMVIMIY